MGKGPKSEAVIYISATRFLLGSEVNNVITGYFWCYEGPTGLSLGDPILGKSVFDWRLRQPF